MNAHAARTVCVLNALSASVEARLAEAARGVAEAEAGTRLLERALDAESGETTTSDADARVEAVSSAGSDGGRGRGGGDVGGGPAAANCRATPPPRPGFAAPGTPDRSTCAANAMVNDPKYGIYFKMIKMGVPEQAHEE